MTCSMKLGLRVLCFQLKLVDLGRPDRHQLESAFISVEPAPFFQFVFEMQTKTETLFAIAVHLYLSKRQRCRRSAGGSWMSYSNPFR